MKQPFFRSGSIHEYADPIVATGLKNSYGLDAIDATGDHERNPSGTARADVHSDALEIGGDVAGEREPGGIVDKNVEGGSRPCHLGDAATNGCVEAARFLQFEEAAPLYKQATLSINEPNRKHLATLSLEACAALNRRARRSRSALTDYMQA
ncbi:hypothetical protein [Sphingomonas abietis]|uniref:Tetratricopeptide repeat protein n=1 Tax=Sphingomonas abietis TaxID=3012344 RepID=A0ABY7NK97_9SPHN|nr:hypothetical protein [Sphingomonas abietis]WBO21768.1 hypothetical protein PBT88_16590 [Sphingomonas abietis]